MRTAYYVSGNKVLCYDDDYVEQFTEVGDTVVCIPSKFMKNRNPVSSRFVAVPVDGGTAKHLYACRGDADYAARTSDRVEYIIKELNATEIGKHSKDGKFSYEYVPERNTANGLKKNDLAVFIKQAWRPLVVRITNIQECGMVDCVYFDQQGQRFVIQDELPCYFVKPDIGKQILKTMKGDIEYALSLLE